MAASGNPLYPLEVKVGGKVLMPGYSAETITPLDYYQNYARSTAEWLLYPWVERKRDPGYLLIPYSVDTGFGAAFAAFAPLAVAFGLWRLARRKSSGLEAVLLASTVLLLIPWWFVLRRMPRFSLPILLLACILTAPLFAYVRSRAMEWLLLVCICATCLISGLVVVHDVVGTRHLSSRAAFYRYPEPIDGFPPGSRVAYWRGTNNNFAIFGAELTNRVVPEFEVPDTLDSGWLARNRIDYVVSNLPMGESPPPTPAEMSLVYDHAVRVSEDQQRHWLIWRVSGSR